LPIANRCALLLRENFTPYNIDLKKSPDEELRWCVVKNEHLIEDPKFEQMYALDKENRSAILDALALRITPNEAEQKEELIIAADGMNENKIVSFIEVLRPIGNSADDTLQFIKLKLEEAKFQLNLLSKIDKLSNGKNPYGLNGAIAAMIDFFYQHNYFKKDYTLEQVFNAYSAYTGNSIAKFKTFFSEFRQDNNYRKHFEKLKSLKINKLK
jgi:hypothetical protein